MDLAIQSLGIPDGLAGWQVLQKVPDTGFKQFTGDPVLKADIAYFEKNAPKATTAAKLLADPRLAKVALTAYGLSAQIGSTALMAKVLNSNTADKTSFASKMASPTYMAIAKAFGYGDAPTTAAVKATASSATVTVGGLNGTNGFDTFSGSFAGVTLGNVDMSGATTRQAIAAKLQAAFRQADGGGSAITVAVSGLDLVFSDASGRGTASGFAWSSTTDSHNSTARASSPASATVTVGGLDGTSGFNTFSGTMGGVAVSGVDLSGAATPTAVAAALQAAFQQADGGRSAITVTASGQDLVFSDASDRGGASGFAWGGTATAAAPSSSLVAGSPAVPAGGAVPSSAGVALGALATSGTSFRSFSGTFGGVSVKDVILSGADSTAAVAAALQAAFQKADGNNGDITVTATSAGVVFSDAKGRGTAKNFAWTAGVGGGLASAPMDTVAGRPAQTIGGGAVLNPTPAVASQAFLGIDGLNGTGGFGQFSGSFGGVSLSGVDLTGATTRQAVASKLQQAFQRADGGRSDITVTVSGLSLRFSDAKGRGLLSGLSLPTDGAEASAATVALSAPDAKGDSFAGFGGTFGGVHVSGVDLRGAKSTAAVAAALQQAFQAADGGSGDITVTATKDGIVFGDARGRGSASGFSWTAGAGGGTAAAPSAVVAGREGSGTATHGAPFNMQAGHPVLPAVAGSASKATVALGELSGNGLGFLGFSGTFGGVAVKNASLIGATSNAEVAAALQAAFRKADGGSTNISVTATADGISFADAAGRGTAKGFAWTAGLGHGSAGAAGGLITGTPSQMSAGGPRVASADFIKTVVAKYTDAQFQAVVGNTSNTLRSALYAKEMLPTITNWYSVIADKNLAPVIQTALGLPSSFGQVDVDRQAEILKGKMKIKDFQDPEKLKKLLTQYVAIGSAQEAQGGGGLASPGVTLLANAVSGGAGFSLSSGSAAALLLST